MKPTLEQIQAAKLITNDWVIYFALTLAEQLALGEVVVVPKEYYDILGNFWWGSSPNKDNGYKLNDFLTAQPPQEASE